MADKGWSRAFEEIVIRVQCTIPKTGKVFETSISSGQSVMSCQIITSEEEVPLRPWRDFPNQRPTSALPAFQDGHSLA